MVGQGLEAAPGTLVPCREAPPSRGSVHIEGERRKLWKETNLAKNNPIVKFGGTTAVKKLMIEAGGDPTIASPYVMAEFLAAKKGWSTRGSKRKLLTKVLRQLTGYVPPQRVIRRIPQAAAKPVVLVEVIGTPTVAHKKAFYESWGWTTLRMQILKRFGRTCMCCGAKPGNGIIMHVDHIKPLSKYWELRLDPDNLQVLCNTCNKGKGAWDETDYRPPAPDLSRSNLN